jgi:hypothetical protein
MTKTSRDDIETLLSSRGLILSPSQFDQILAGWAMVQPMLDAIRASDRDRGDEPALIFRADTSTPPVSATKTP